MFITANTRRPVTASSVFKLIEYFEMVHISQNITYIYVCMQTCTHVYTPDNYKYAYVHSITQTHHTHTNTHTTK